MEKLTNPAQKLLIGVLMAVILALASCKGNPSTMSGDSTGTGAAGARTQAILPKIIARPLKRNRYSSGKKGNPYLPHGRSS
jgi:hypothetical protein